MGRHLRVQPNVTTYLQAAQAQGIRRAVQSIHAGMTGEALATRLSQVYPNLHPATIDEIITQANNAIQGADDINRTIMTVPVLQPSTWGYDPSLTSEWSLHFVYFTPAPTSWWTRLIEDSGETLPLPVDLVKSISAIERLGGRPSMSRPYPENSVYTGLVDFMPEIGGISKRAIKILVGKARNGKAPPWFQAAYDESLRLGLDLDEWGTNFSAIVAGVYRSIRHPEQP